MFYISPFLMDATSREKIKHYYEPNESLSSIAAAARHCKWRCPLKRLSTAWPFAIGPPWVQQEVGNEGVNLQHAGLSTQEAEFSRE